MHYVYLLRSTVHPDKTYIGRTEDVDKRLAAHNQGDSKYTSRFKPWELILFLGIPSEEKAIELERYLPPCPLPLRA
ncbi:MAG: GIY-YIG nuclease family protein [Verrucomicrobia bacterium]|nr:GIY-YIG nuclease family protein [Verrucomicrobiota bacterium]